MSRDALSILALLAGLVVGLAALALRWHSRGRFGIAAVPLIIVSIAGLYGLVRLLGGDRPIGIRLSVACMSFSVVICCFALLYVLRRDN